MNHEENKFNDQELKELYELDEKEQELISKVRSMDRSGNTNVAERDEIINELNAVGLKGLYKRHDMGLLPPEVSKMLEERRRSQQSQ